MDFRGRRPACELTMRGSGGCRRDYIRTDWMAPRTYRGGGSGGDATSELYKEILILNEFSQV